MKNKNKIFFSPQIKKIVDFMNSYHSENEYWPKLNEIGRLKSNSNGKRQHYFSFKDELYPYLLVNLRSGATFTRVNSLHD